MLDGFSNLFIIIGQNQRSFKGSWRIRLVIVLDLVEVFDKVESDRGRVQILILGFLYVYIFICIGRDKKNLYINIIYISFVCKREKRYEFGIIFQMLRKLEKQLKYFVLFCFRLKNLN